MTIELSHDLQMALEKEATLRGTSPQALAMHFIEQHLPPKPSDEATGQTMFDKWKAHFDSLPKSDPNAPKTDYSQDTGRKFAEALLEKRQQGRL